MDFNTVHLLFFVLSAEFLFVNLNFSVVLILYAEKISCRCGNVGLSAEKFLKSLRIFGKAAKICHRPHFADFLFKLICSS